MRQAWGEFLRTARPHSHGVQLYGAPDELVASVVAFASAGLDRGEAAILVAVPEHAPLFEGGLADAGWDVAAVKDAGLLLVAAAELLLASFMEAGAPSAERFERSVGGLIDATAGSDRRVRVFGEMVDVLVRRGETDAADELERLWNGLAATRDFSLLCGYRLDVFDGAVQTGTLPRVCRAHSHVLPAPNYPRFARAVDDALRVVLGPSEAASVYVRVTREADARDESHVPLAQLLLMWVTRNLPRQSGRILDTARLRYSGTT
jgi:MEDS: MEthanogen/methylotroph, DcmR Sensory domain